MTRGERVAAAAIALVGARFRPHGRDPATGLDCVGLALLALRAGGFEAAVPTGYALRGGDPNWLGAQICARGLVAGEGAAQIGELLLCASGPAQVHFAIRVETGLVHADASLRRVVLRPGAPPWPVIGRWHLPEED